MFRRLLDHGATRKSKISLTNMKLIDIPPCQSLVFMKFKQGRHGGQSQKLPITKAAVYFANPLLFDYEMPVDATACHPKPLRLSFQLENPYSTRFTRYGIAEIDVMQCILDGRFDIRVLLRDCSYNTYFMATLHIVGQAPFPTRPSCSIDESPPRESAASSSSSTSTSDALYAAVPMAISRETFDRLERQVDLMLAELINSDRLLVM
jgi:hypothetical protein